MTGYGKSEVIFGNKKYIVEIRSLNGKNIDTSLKTQIVPRDKELDLRKYIAEELLRGNVDLFINEEVANISEAKTLNSDVFMQYYKQLENIATTAGISLKDQKDVLSSVLRLPEVVTSVKEEMSDDCWATIRKAVEVAVEALKQFRAKEGLVLRKDLQTRVENILTILDEAESYEQERVQSIREKMSAKMEELKINPDRDRYEQEMIFYIEKLDVNEEKVRLRQHCKYFTETMDAYVSSGKKLGFIAQEMGREINTLGSKSNHAGMQKCVVRMKDELEKIKEQVLNVL